MRVALSSRMWTRAASIEVGELPLESAAGGTITAIAGAFSGLGTVVSTARHLGVAVVALAGVGTVVLTARGLRVPTAALAGVGTLGATLLEDDAGGGTVHDAVVAFGGVGSLAALAVRLGVPAVALSGVGTLAGTLEGGTPVVASNALFVRVRLDRVTGPSFRVGG